MRRYDVEIDMLASLMRKRLARFAARDGPASQRAGLPWRRVSDKWLPTRKRAASHAPVGDTISKLFGHVGFAPESRHSSAGNSMSAKGQ
jgi:hypothetical protein